MKEHQKKCENNEEAKERNGNACSWYSTTKQAEKQVTKNLYK